MNTSQAQQPWLDLLFQLLSITFTLVPAALAVLLLALTAGSAAQAVRDLGLDLRRPGRDLWQGLAQICVGLTHAARGNATGAVRLIERGVGRLTAYAGGPGPTYGLDLAEVTDCARRRVEGA